MAIRSYSPSPAGLKFILLFASILFHITVLVSADEEDKREIQTTNDDIIIDPAGISNLTERSPNSHVLASRSMETINVCQKLRGQYQEPTIWVWTDAICAGRFDDEYTVNCKNVRQGTDIYGKRRTIQHNICPPNTRCVGHIEENPYSDAPDKLSQSIRCEPKYFKGQWNNNGIAGRIACSPGIHLPGPSTGSVAFLAEFFKTIGRKSKRDNAGVEVNRAWVQSNWNGQRPDGTYRVISEISEADDYPFTHEFHRSETIQICFVSGVDELVYAKVLATG